MPPLRTTRPVRVLHVIQNLNYGGMERVLADIVRHVDPLRIQSAVLCLQYLGRFSEGLRHSSVVRVAPKMSRWSMLRPAALARAIREIAPDVLHTHSGVWYKAWRAGRIAGVPCLIHTEHGRQLPDPWSARVFDGAAARRTHFVVAVSQVLADQMVRTLGVDERHVRVIPNGVDTDEYRPRPDGGGVRSALAIPPGAAIIGSIGRLEPIKGYDVMLAAMDHFRSLSMGQPEPVLVVAGEGSERPRLKSIVARLGLEDRVRMVGWRDDVHALNAAFTLFTMSSRSEGTSISLLEAMSSGLCPVVTNVGGNAAVLGGDLRHRLVPSEDPVALARAWLDVLRDDKRRTADAKLARQIIEARYSLDGMVRSYQDLYLTCTR